MNFLVVAGCVAGLALGAGRAAAAFSPAELDQLPPAATRQVDFKKDIVPIFNASCVKCHGRGKAKGGFQMDTRETFLQEADSGPAVVPGNSRESRLIHLVAALDPADVMPVKGSRLTAEQVGLLRAWIDQGMPWDEGISFAREEHRNLARRKPELPVPSGDWTRPMDRFVRAYFEERGIKPPSVVDDRRFARRVYLDVTGLLPAPNELEAFEADAREDKRERLVRRLLDQDQAYAQHWLSFWNDLLRNDYRGTGYIDGGREQITRWLYAALKDNLPYDEFVRQLVNPGKDGPAGFVKGIVWRGAVNASQRPPIQAAQNVSQVFLGVNLKCASCHDSFIDDWQLADAYGMAAVFTEERLELVECDRPLGRYADVKFLFPELGGIPADASREQRMARLAELVTMPENGRLPRTIVNRLWSRFMGRGLVEPLDVMQNPAWSPDLLDWLAEDLVEHDYDLKRVMEQILTSRAYQLPAVDLGDETSTGGDFVFRGPGVRRMSAEQFRDALGQLTGVWNGKPEGNLDQLLFEAGKPTDLKAPAYWVWSDPHAAEGVPPQKIYLRKTVRLAAGVEDALALVHADNTHRLWVNGREARRKNDIPWNETSILDLRPFLKEGENVFAVEAENQGEGPNPAGLLFYARLRGKDGAAQDFGTDSSWRVSAQAVEGWHKTDFDDSGWQQAQALGPADAAPWRVGEQFAAAVGGQSVYGRVRASLVPADPLAQALGRPNREQVTSRRSPTATTIQMLELTNGETLAKVLSKGAEQLTRGDANGRALVEDVFLRALGRRPNPRELSLSVALVGERPQAEGVEDLLWSVAMLPEFQLIY
jgi:mono/diheme cytochrome c family protein